MGKIPPSCSCSGKGRRLASPVFSTTRGIGSPFPLIAAVAPGLSFATEEKAAKSQEGEEKGTGFRNTYHDGAPIILNGPLMNEATGLIVVLQGHPHPPVGRAIVVEDQGEAYITGCSRGELREMGGGYPGCAEARGSRTAGVHRVADAKLLQGINIARTGADRLPARTGGRLIGVVGDRSASEEEVGIASGKSCGVAGGGPGFKIHRDAFKGGGDGDVLVGEPEDGSRCRGGNSKQENGGQCVSHENLGLQGSCKRGLMG